jgi:hypothetical protein
MPMTCKSRVGKISRDTHDIKKLVKKISTAYNFQDSNSNCKRRAEMICKL